MYECGRAAQTRTSAGASRLAAMGLLWMLTLTVGVAAGRWSTHTDPRLASQPSQLESEVQASAEESAQPPDAPSLQPGLTDVAANPVIGSGDVIRTGRVLYAAAPLTGLADFFDRDAPAVSDPLPTASDPLSVGSRHRFLP